jgi:hypothetical protein
MERNRDWNVTVHGRIEHVTDLDSFPDLLQAALAAQPHISVIRFDTPTWPHTTSVVVRIRAGQKDEAEKAASEMMLPIWKSVAVSILGEQNFGWTLGVDAAPVVTKTSIWRSIAGIPNRLGLIASKVTRSIVNMRRN